MKSLFITLLLFLISCFSFSQNEANVWIFANNTGLDFSTTPPEVLYNTPVMYAFSTSCYSDENGDLKLFSDGMKIWSGNKTVMMNGDGLLGDLGCTQSSIIVPHPGSQNSFYVFAVDKIYGSSPLDKGLTYSRVDMNSNGGLGQVVEKNVPLIEKTPEKVTAVKHANGIDYWVITHEWGNNDFYVYPVTAAQGLHKDNPKIIKVGSDHVSQYSRQGYLKASPDGRYLACAQWEGIVELFSFNDQTGEINLLASANFPNAYGVEFDAESRFLYLSTSPQFGSSEPSVLFQFDLTHQRPLDTPVEITRTTDWAYASLQLGPDRKIYCAQYVSATDPFEYLSIIHNPSRPGLHCNFNLIDNEPNEGIDLGGKKLLAGLPNFVTSYLKIPFFTYDSICYNNLVRFSITNKENIDTFSWDFDDPESGTFNSASDWSPTHVFTAPGTYDVSVTVSFNGRNYSYTHPVVVNPLPVIDFGADTIYLFPGALAPLEVDEGYLSYLWNDGSTQNLFLADEPGIYSVVVTDSIGCQNKKTVSIFPANIYFPNAFSPNGDGVNDVFRPTGANSGLFNIRMFVYNRMGQLMYESPVVAVLGEAGSNFGWDGTKAGALQPAGSYIWIVKFDVEKEKGQFSTEHYTGSITLLR